MGRSGCGREAAVGQCSTKARAERLAHGLQNAEVLPKLNLAGVARVLAGARACGG